MSTLGRILLFVSVAAVFPPAAEPASQPPAEGPALLINEIMASNSSSVQDPQGHYDDWIELYNTGAQPVNVGGMCLTNDPAVPTRWRIPVNNPSPTTIQPHGYLLIWADADTRNAGLHANFRLDAAGGQLALIDVDGQTLIDGVEFGEQTSNISYGRDPTAGNEWRFFGVPTPGKQNVGAYLGAVADLRFSHERGFYTEPLTVAITTATPGASIVFTVDGSSPFDTVRGTPTGRPYTGPISITMTTCLRAVAFKVGWMPTSVTTHTYIFLDDVIGQATDSRTKALVTPPGYPTSWGSVMGDYQMDPDVVGQNGTDIFGGLYARTIKDDLKAGPTISLVMDKDNWFGTRGIYINQSQDGTERVASFEFIDPRSGDTIQVNCALAMQGGVTGGGTSLDRWKTFKLSMRPRFKPQTDDGKSTGGPPSLKVKLFKDSPLEQHNTIVLDAVLNHSWLHPGDNRQSRPYTRQDWLNTQTAKLTGFFPTRSNQVLTWLKGANLYPSLDAPAFRVNGLPQHGGHIAARDSLSMTAGGGDIWYTLDGNDPRVPGSTPARSDALVLVPETVQVLAWGAGNLADSGEKVQLSKPGDTEEDGTRHWLRVDRVVYSDGTGSPTRNNALGGPSHPQDFPEGMDPWAVQANGQGLSLSRIDPHAYGNDPENWKAATPLPGW